MKEWLAVFESDIDRPLWFTVRARFRSWAIQMATRMLRHRVGSQWRDIYGVTVVVSR